MMICELPREIQEYIDLVESGTPKACKEQHALVAHVKKCFATEDIYVDCQQLENYLGLLKYFPYEQLRLQRTTMEA